MGNVLGNTINDGIGNTHRGLVSGREVRHVGRPEVKTNTRSRLRDVLHYSLM